MGGQNGQLARNLQLVKAGKLTAEEYEIMKTHAEKGGEIITSTFGNAGDEEYDKIAREGI